MTAVIHQYKGDDRRDPKVGDWVRFYQNGKLTIGVVEYIEKDLLGYANLKTDIGCIDIRYVLEARRCTVKKEMQ